MGSPSNGGRGVSSNFVGDGKGVDSDDYFCTYDFLYHQKEKLCDRIRMRAYYDAIFENRENFRGKTMLDVGTGSGILAVWSAKAGAKKVYAIEETKMYVHARQLVKLYDFQDVVQVMEGSVKDISLPEKVDVIISEWMGYFLVLESMFESVILARDRWLKPSGVMFPSHARMWMAPIKTGLLDQKMSDFKDCMDDWHNFIQKAKTKYGVDMSVFNETFSEYQEIHYLRTSMWKDLHPDQVIGTPAIIREFNCLKVTVSEILEVKATYVSPITENQTRLCGFAGWFDVHFRTCSAMPEVALTSAPSEYSKYNRTHWGQQVFLLHPSVCVSKGDALSVSFSMVRSKENHHLMQVELECEVTEASGSQYTLRRMFFSKN